MRDVGPPISPETLNPLYPAVGSLILQWAMLEQMLEAWVAIIFRSWNIGSRLNEKQIPFQFSNKVRFLRKAFERIPELENYAQEGLSLLDQIEPVGKTRDILVHGALCAYDDATNTFSFRRLPIDREQMIHVETIDRLTGQQILDAGGTMLYLGKRSTKFANCLLGELRE
jgi:hypothetical protein